MTSYMSSLYIIDLKVLNVHFLMMNMLRSRYQDYPHYVKLYEEAVEKAVREAQKAMAAIEKEQQKLTKAEAAHAKEQKARVKADKQATAFEKMVDHKEREEAQKNWVDPRPSMKSPEEWEEIFAELQSSVDVAKQKAEDAKQVIFAKEEELAAQVADRGPRRDQVSVPSSPSLPPASAPLSISPDTLFLCV